MKKIFSLFIVMLGILSLSSCATYTKNAPVYGIGGNNINTYVKANLDLANAQKVEASVEQKYVLWFIPLIFNGNKTLVSSNRYGHLSKVEGLALYRAQQNGNCDIILEPQFTTESHSFFFGIWRTYNTKVTGWGCNIKGLEEDNLSSGTVVRSAYPSLF